MFVLINFHYHLLTEHSGAPLLPPSSFPQGGAFAVPTAAWGLRGLCVHRRYPSLPQRGVVSMEELWFPSPCMLTMWPRVFVELNEATQLVVSNG